MDAGAAMVSIPQPGEPPTDATPPATRTRPSRASAAEAPACKRGPHEVKAGSPALLELIAQSGDTIVGTVHEKDGYDFSVFIVDRPNRAKYLNDSGRCSKLFKRTSTKAADVEFRIPESASLPCYLVLESRGTTYAREVIVELKTRATGARRAQGKVGL